MALWRYVRDNWLGIGGLLVGAVGIIASVVTYFASQRYRAPTFVTDPVRTEIIAREAVEQAPIRVTRADGRPVSSDLTAVRFYFWNAGTDAIRMSHVLEPLRIRVIDPTAEVIDFKLLRVSRPVTGLSLVKGPTANTLEFRFAILEPGDGGTGQVIFEGRADSKIVLAGTVEGSRVRSEHDLIWQRRWHEFAPVMAPAVLLISVMVVMHFGKRIGKSKHRHARELELAAIILTFVLLGSTIWIMLRATSDIASRAAGARSFSRIVPADILPR